MSGDTLTLWALWPGFAVAAVIGAVATPGWRGRVLWGLAFVFAAVAAWLWFKPNPTPWIAATLHSNAWVPIATVGIVALMIADLRKSRVAAEAEPPKIAASPAIARRSGYTPDITLAKAAAYIAAGSTWKGKPEELGLQIRDKLALDRTVAWGARTPDGTIDEIAADDWKDAELDLKSSKVTTEDGRTFYRVQLVTDHVRGLWPPKRTSPTGY